MNSQPHNNSLLAYLLGLCVCTISTFMDQSSSELLCNTEKDKSTIHHRTAGMYVCANLIWVWTTTSITVSVVIIQYYVYWDYGCLGFLPLKYHPTSSFRIEAWPSPKCLLDFSNKLQWNFQSTELHWLLDSFRQVQFDNGYGYKFLHWSILLCYAFCYNTMFTKWFYLCAPLRPIPFSTTI